MTDRQRISPGLPRRRYLVEDQDGAPLPDEVQRARLFFLWREDDITEVTVERGGEPRCVAVGTQFADGKCALWWSGGSVAVWPDLASLEATHLHPRSKTTLRWVD